MFSNDLNNAYMFESQRRADEINDAVNCRLCHEAAGDSAKKTSPLATLSALLLALVALFIRH